MSAYFTVGRPRLNRSNEIPSGDLKPQKPKPTQALLKQSNETIKMAAQNIVPVNEVPTLANEVVTVTTSETENVPTSHKVPSTPENGINLNVSNTQEVTTTEPEKIPDVKISQPNVIQPASVTTTPPKIIQQSNAQFVQVKAPTTTSGRVQSPTVKNFFIRKGIEKQPSNQQQQILSTSTYLTTSQATPSPQISVAQMPTNKKIIIKSQQILVPAGNIKPNTTQTHQIVQVSGQSNNTPTTSTPISINANVIESSSSDLSGILDLPILFADNSEGGVQIAQSGQILNTSGTSNITLLNTSNDRNTSIGSSANIFISSPDGKLPNRSVVISAAKITKPLHQNTVTTPTSTANKVIFINRNQIKPQIVGTQAVSGTSMVKGLQTLKLLPTTLASPSTSTPITFQANQLTKLTPGTKIDLSQLKLLKNTASSTVQSGMMKPLIINKGTMPTKNAIVIKSSTGTNVVQSHPIIKGNVLNKNITVRKVMNVMPSVKQSTTPIVTPIITPIVNPAASPVPSVNSSPIKTTTTPVASSSTTPVASTVSSTLTKTTTRKTRNSN